MSDTVYAEEPFVYCWSSVRANHKQGKIAANTPLVVLSESGPWYEIDEPPLDREVKPGYPNFFVKKEDVNDGPVGPVPQPNPQPTPEGAVSFEQAAAGLAMFLKWLKQ